MSELRSTSPKVIIVAPSRLRIPWFIVAFMTVPATIVLTLLYVVAQSSAPARQVQLMTGLPKLAIALGASAVAAIVLSGVMIRGINRKSISRNWPAPVVPPDEPVARALSGIWRSVSRPPPPSRVRAVLAEHDVDFAEQPVVAALGTAEVPDPSDVPFEPEVITPGQRFAKGNSTLVWAAVVLAVSLVGPRVFPGFPSFIRGGYLLFGIALIIAARWVWANVVRIGYLRIAPGMIQVLRYHMFSRTPEVRSYPIEAGTMVVLLQFLWFLRLQVSRGELVDEVSLTGVKDHKAVAETIWRAVRSTAPTPPLSETGSGRTSSTTSTDSAVPGPTAKN